LGQATALLREEPRARLFFAALTQSSLGTGAAHIALLLIAYDRFHSPWAISLVLLADFAPAMFLGAVLGAAADRWSRKWCVVLGDVIRAAAFVALALVDSFTATFALALVAGLGTALFRPAALAGLPALVSPGRLPPATSLYGAIADMGYTVGPAVAAGALLLVSPEDLLVANGVTFAISALVLTRLRLDRVAALVDHENRPSLIGDVREGLRAVAGMGAIRVLIATSTGAMFFGGVFNVVELPFATSALGANSSEFGALVAVFGLAFVLGSLRGSAGGTAPVLKRRYLQGVTLMGLGALLAGLAPNVPLALLGFAIGGFGNGLFVVHERLLFQQQIAERLLGRVFGLSDALVSWGLALAFVLAAIAVEALGSRGTVLLTGAGGLVLAAVATLRMHREWVEDQAPAPPRASASPG
jgi:MFS family permease